AGARLPAEAGHRGTAPATVDVETEEMIEEVVARGDRGEHVPHIGSLGLASGGGEDFGPRGGRHKRGRKAGQPPRRRPPTSSGAGERRSGAGVSRVGASL